MGCPPLQKKGGGYPWHLENSQEHTSRYYHSPCVSFVLKFFSKRSLCEGGWKLKQ